MAIAEHEATPQEVTPQEAIQSITVRLTEAQAAALRQAAEAKGQSLEDFVVSVSVRAAHGPHESLVLPVGRDPLDSIVGIFKDEPLMDALMERIHEEQRQGIEQFRLEAEAEEAAEQARLQRP